MIWTSNPKRWPEGVDDDRLYGGVIVDGDGKRHDASKDHDDDVTWAMRVDTLTGEVVYILRHPDGQTMIDAKRGKVMTGQLALTPPLLLYSREGVLLNPQDKADTDTPMIISTK